MASAASVLVTGDIARSVGGLPPHSLVGCHVWIYVVGHGSYFRYSHSGDAANSGYGACIYTYDDILYVCTLETFIH